MTSDLSSALEVCMMRCATQIDVYINLLYSCIGQSSVRNCHPFYHSKIFHKIQITKLWYGHGSSVTRVFGIWGTETMKYTPKKVATRI